MLLVFIIPLPRHERCSVIFELELPDQVVSLGSALLSALDSSSPESDRVNPLDFELALMEFNGLCLGQLELLYNVEPGPPDIRFVVLQDELINSRVVDFLGLVYERFEFGDVGIQFVGYLIVVIGNRLCSVVLPLAKRVCKVLLCVLRGEPLQTSLHGISEDVISMLALHGGETLLEEGLL